MPDCEQKHCPYCGHPLPPGTSFCLHCCKRLVQTRRPLNRKPFPGALPLSAGALLLAGCVLTVLLVREPPSGLPVGAVSQPPSSASQAPSENSASGSLTPPAEPPSQPSFSGSEASVSPSPPHSVSGSAPASSSSTGSSVTINRTGYYGEVVTNAYRLEQAIKSLIRQEDSGLYVPSAMYRPDIMATDPLYTKFMASYETDLRVLKVNTSRPADFTALYGNHWYTYEIRWKEKPLLSVVLEDTSGFVQLDSDGSYTDRALEPLLMFYAYRVITQSNPAHSSSFDIYTAMLKTRPIIWNDHAQDYLWAEDSAAFVGSAPYCLEITQEGYFHQYELYLDGEKTSDVRHRLYFCPADRYKGGAAKPSLIPPEKTWAHLTTEAGLRQALAACPCEILKREELKNGRYRYTLTHRTEKNPFTMEFSVYGDYVRFTIEQRILYQPEAVGSSDWAAARARMDTMRSVAAEIAARITPDYTENIAAYLRADSSGRQKLTRGMLVQTQQYPPVDSAKDLSWNPDDMDKDGYVTSRHIIELYLY